MLSRGEGIHIVMLSRGEGIHTVMLSSSSAMKSMKPCRCSRWDGLLASWSRFWCSSWHLQVGLKYNYFTSVFQRLSTHNYNVDACQISRSPKDWPFNKMFFDLKCACTSVKYYCLEKSEFSVNFMFYLFKSCCLKSPPRNDNLKFCDKWLHSRAPVYRKFASETHWKKTPICLNTSIHSLELII